MRINTTSIFCKYSNLKIHLIIFYSLLSFNIYAQGFTSITTINDVLATEKTTSGEKPQSKVWKNGDYWWAVIPVNADIQTGDPAGAYLWRLDGSNWTKLWRLSPYGYYPDAKSIGDVTHIMLLRTSLDQAILVSIEYVPGSTPTYQPWSQRPTPVTIPLYESTEILTIDIDSQGKMWLAYDVSTAIEVCWSESPYETWSSPIPIGSCTNDDICAVTAFGGDKIGVLWSNQTDSVFQFRYRFDTDNEDIWSDTEVATSSLPVGDGLADDHINLAVHSNGNIYAAVKTSYDTDGYPAIALLIRSTGGSWQLESVRNMHSGVTPTRPIALLDETAGGGIITVVYTYKQNGGDIMYKSSYISPLSFYPEGDGEVLIPASPRLWNNVTSTKQNFNPEVVILASQQASTISGRKWIGVKALGITPTPVELAYFAGALDDNKVELHWRTETEVSNYGFDIERQVENSYWEKLGFVEGHGNSNSPKDYSFEDYDISRAGKYKYRLKQIDNDGKFEYSYVITVYVGAPAAFYLSQNYPNPFNPSTKIDYSVPQASKVSLKVYDILGREVALLVNEYKEIGTYNVRFDASNLPGGIYFYTISAGSFIETKKMSLVK